MCQVRTPRGAVTRRSQHDIAREIRRLELELAESAGIIMARDFEIQRLRIANPKQ